MVRMDYSWNSKAWKGGELNDLSCLYVGFLLCSSLMCVARRPATGEPCTGKNIFEFTLILDFSILNQLSNNKVHVQKI